MELQKGAYQGDIGTKACKEAYATVLKLRDKVKPKDEEDTQITSAKTHGHHTAAACLGRAGDCKAAMQVYRDGEMKSEWTSRVTDAAQLDTMLKSNFESSVQKCKGKV